MMLAAPFIDSWAHFDRALLPSLALALACILVGELAKFVLARLWRWLTHSKRPETGSLRRRAMTIERFCFTVCMSSMIGVYIGFLLLLVLSWFEVAWEKAVSPWINLAIPPLALLWLVGVILLIRRLRRHSIQRRS